METITNDPGENVLHFFNRLRREEKAYNKRSSRLLKLKKIIDNQFTDSEKKTLTTKLKAISEKNNDKRLKLSREIEYACRGNALERLIDNNILSEQDVKYLVFETRKLYRDVQEAVRLVVNTRQFIATGNTTKIGRLDIIPHLDSSNQILIGESSDALQLTRSILDSIDGILFKHEQNTKIQLADAQALMELAEEIRYL